MAESNRLLTFPAKWLNRLSPLLLLLAIIWLCWGLSRIVWLLLSPPEAPKVQYLPRQAEIKPQSSNMSAFTIFKNPEIKRKEPTKVKTNTPPPNMKLKGVMEASPMSNSSAMIELNGQMKNYRVGNKIEDTGYTLGFVDWNKIIIEDSNQTETIIELNDEMELDQEFVANSGSNRRNTSKQKRKITNRSSQNNNSKNNKSKNNNFKNNSPKIPAPNQSKTVNKTQSNNGTSNTNPIDKIAAELTKNPSGYLSKMGVMATGNGYSVTDAMPFSIRSKIGLQSGDKVISVNGQNVGSNPANDAQLLKKVKKSGQAQIQVKRGNQIITIRQQLK